MLGGVVRQVCMNLKVNEYTSRVLGVIKEKYGLKDKAQALDKFAQIYGDKYISAEELKATEQRAINEVKNEKDSLKLYGYRRLVEEGEDTDKLFKY